jgi:L-alanine-DL-glutamate epimerase-like enolase superfamily enzyme
MPESLWPLIADLPLTIEDYALERLERDVSSDFHRVSTVIRVHGGGHDGVGEDVSYDEDDQAALQNAGTIQPLAGEWTLGSFCDHVATLDLWPEPARHDASVLYRVWGYESAALDLALRQAGKALHEVLGRTPQPVRFVVSLRLGPPPSPLAPLRARLDPYPETQFKLDPTDEWDDDIVAALADTGAVESVDFKGFYKGTVVDTLPDPKLYGRVLRALPHAWIEDPHDTPEIRALLERKDALARVSYDAPIHSVQDILALPIAPKMVNVKPSRLGGLRPLLAAYAHCEEHDIGMYGGGQFELGPGRGHIQYLASLFHADAPNDTAPGGYNDPDPPPGLPTSPLPVAVSDTGFRWG